MTNQGQQLVGETQHPTLNNSSVVYDAKSLNLTKSAHDLLKGVNLASKIYPNFVVNKVCFLTPKQKNKL